MNVVANPVIIVQTAYKTIDKLKIIFLLNESATLPEKNPANTRGKAVASPIASA